MARSTVAQAVQIGKETTPGVAVPANKRLQSLSVALSPEVESSSFRPRGSKYVTTVAANKEWSSGDLEGTPTYDEIVYPLSSVFTGATVAAVMDGATPTAANVWTFEPSTNDADLPVTFTLEQGDATLADQAAHLLFTDFGMNFTRDEVSLSGSAFAKALVRGFTLTPDPVAVAADLVPILPGQVCLYASSDPATLGTEATHIDTGLSLDLKVGGRFNPVWYLNCRADSFGAFVEAPEPDYSADLMLEADASGMEWAERFRTGETTFLRIEATGPEIEVGVPETAYRLTWDLAVKVLEPGEYSDEDGLYAIGPALQVVHDASWGRASRITVVNTVTAL